MSVLLTVIDALAPIAFVILLGVLAGRTGIMKSESSSVLADLALEFCLPALLFGTIAAMSIAQLTEWRFFTGIGLGLLLIYAVAFVISLYAFHKPVSDSSLQALNSGYPNMGFMGIPILTAIVGTSSVLSVVIGNLISSFLLIPLTLILLEAGAPSQKERKMGPLIGVSVLAAVKKPLVWAPILAVLMVVLGIPLPSVAKNSLSLLGTATSGVALFSMGLLLSGRKFHVSLASLTNVAFKNLVQPAVMLGLAIFLGVTGLDRREMILLGALPAASTAAMFAIQYKVYINDSDATIVISTIFSVVSIGVIVALT